MMHMQLRCKRDSLLRYDTGCVSRGITFFFIHYILILPNEDRVSHPVKMSSLSFARCVCVCVCLFVIDTESKTPRDDRYFILSIILSYLYSLCSSCFLFDYTFDRKQFPTWFWSIMHMVSWISCRESGECGCQSYYYFPIFGSLPVSLKYHLLSISFTFSPETGMKEFLAWRTIGTVWINHLLLEFGQLQESL